MAKVPANAYNTNLFSVKMAVNQAPKLSIDRNKNIVKWGQKNDYPSRLLFWFNNDAEHGAICKGKARYLAGLSISSDNPTADLWLKKANPIDSWHELDIKTILDEVISGGYFLKIISNPLGQPLYYYHLDFAKCRVSDCQKFVKYSDDWSDSQSPITIFPIWNKNTYGTSVFVYKQYAPSATKLSGTYSQPEYLSCTLDIDTDVRISSFGNSLVSKNFSAGHIVTVFNGEKDKAVQKKITENIVGTYAGEDETGSTVVVFTGENGKPTEITSVPTNDLDKQYEAISKRNQQKKLTGHNVSGVLFKIKTEGQLGNRSELIEAHELFLNEYVKIKQQIQIDIKRMFFKLRTGQDAEFTIEQVKPIGLELPLDNQNVITAINNISPEILNNYLIDKYGLQMPESKVDSNGVVIKQSDVNDNLRGLSAAENADMLRIVRDYQKGRSGMSEAMAVHRIASYGISEDEARKYLGIEVKACSHVHFAEQDKFSVLFDKYSHDINLEDDVLKVRYIDGSVKFDEDLPKEQTDLVLNEIKLDPKATPQKIADKLKIDLSLVEKIVSFLAEMELVSIVSGLLIPTSKGMDYDSGTEIYTEYVYVKRPDVDGPVILSTTRDFCRKMVNLTRSKALSYEAINRINNEFGENAWDFRGGFYNDGDQTTPWCRHIWAGVTKIRRKK
jgi:hypothetical protein